MKLSNFIKQLNKIKKEHGDILIEFDEYTINTLIEENDEDSDFRIDEESCIVPFRIIGVHKISYEERNNRPKVLLLGLHDGVSVVEKDDKQTF